MLSYWAVLCFFSKVEGLQACVAGWGRVERCEADKSSRQTAEQKKDGVVEGERVRGGESQEVSARSRREMEKESE